MTSAEPTGRGESAPSPDAAEHPGPHHAAGHRGAHHLDGLNEEEREHLELTGERPSQRANRQLAELLQEMRVVQVGGQILFAFLLAIPFQPTFENIGTADRVLYTMAVVLTCGSMFLLMAPVALHRAWFRNGMKKRIIRNATWMTGAGMAMLGPGILSAVLLVLSVAVNWPGAIAITVVLAGAVLWLWLILPWLGRRADPEDDDED